MTFTDSLDNPIYEDDIVLYPVAYGSSSAHYNIGRVLELEPMVRVEDEHRPRWYYKSMAVRAPKKRGAGIYDNKVPDDPSKRYRMHVRRIRESGRAPWGTNKDSRSTILNVDRVVVITDIYNPLPGDNV